ncbi:SpoIID/LytB domain-containing protein [Salinibacillus kushneri]|uniref:SpoIID/LytB domain-containing protein n=1 Tax=Salinibacillus kushneri TaxID=237682 RepID=UPI001FE20382|nr:SpoIID/LytB domain-containing protein [Salinibacillus kushneri]
MAPLTKHNDKSILENKDMKKLWSISMFWLILLLPINALAEEEMVSVKLVNFIQDSAKLEIHLQGDYTTLTPLISLEKGGKYTLLVKKGKLFLIDDHGKHRLPKSITLIPKSYENNLIYINDRPYQGAMEFSIEKGKYIRPVNQLLLEDYLKGVVPFEVFSTWNLEALKAQSLAARTYALMHLNGEKQMNDTIQFQVYGGYSTFSKTNQAVEETKGEIITHNGNPITAFYSASNGGYTESNANVWGGEAINYYPVKSDPYDPERPWKFTLNKEQLPNNSFFWAWYSPDIWSHLQAKDEEITKTMEKWIEKKGYQDVKILAIPHFSIAEKRNESNRSVKGSITISFMHRILGMMMVDEISLEDVPLSKIRPMIGGSIFKSYLITSTKSTENAYIIKGKGYGHGVGMSQWGAQKMAEAGKNYKEIIEFYFPGTDITQVYKK